MAAKILVVDDTPSIREPLSFLLEEEGYEVETAENGRIALEKVAEFRPQLIFLDVMMPEMNGYEVCEQLKSSEETRGIYVIMLTAKGQQSDRDHSLEIGANEYMSKPYSPSAVLAKVESILGPGE